MTSSSLFICCLTVVLLNVARGQETITTEYGPVVGQTVNVNLLSGTVPVTSFWGIPYAAPPVGDLRFAPPQKHPGWSGEFIASELGNACMQSPLSILWMTHPLWTKFDEDCLTLNIFKPANVVAPLAVFVYIHGGGYQGGAGFQYPGHFLAARDVIVVTINYRLGVFGFASSREKTIKGNMGLLDQTLALQFVRDNIANFGGNPNRVTLFGQSAGATSVGLHLVSPISRGLYYQAIMESGVESNIFAVNLPNQDPDSYIFQVADKLNCTYTTEAELVACMRNADARDLRIADSIQCTPGYFCQGFSPIIDGPGGFIPDKPLTLRQQLGDQSIPIISGINKDDGSFLTIGFIPESSQGGFTREEFQYYLRTRLLDIFKESADSEIDFENAYQAFDWFYTPWPYIDDLEANRQAINKLFTDIGFVYAWDRNAKLNSQYRDTYTYIQSFISPNSTSLVPEWMGVPHNLELSYVWGYGYLLINPDVREDCEIVYDVIGWVPEDMTYTDYVQTLWTNFGKYGNPTPTPVKSPFNNTMTTWPKYNINDNLKVIDLDAEISIKENYRQPERYFYTDYLSYITKHEIRDSGEKTEPRKKFQMKASMFQDTITKQVYEIMRSRFPEMSHLSLEEFIELYDV